MHIYEIKLLKLSRSLLLRKEVVGTLEKSFSRVAKFL